MKVKRESEVAQSCPTLSDPMDCSPPGSSVHGILRARVLEWGAIALEHHHLPGFQARGRADTESPDHVGMCVCACALGLHGTLTREVSAGGTHCLRACSHHGNRWLMGTNREAGPECVCAGALPVLSFRSQYRAGICRDGSVFPEAEGGGEGFKMESEAHGGGAMRAADEDAGAVASAAGTAHGGQGVPGGAAGHNGPGIPAGPGDAVSREVPAGSGDRADPRGPSAAGESGGAAAAIPQIPGPPNAPGPGGDTAPGARVLSNRVFQLYPIPGAPVGQAAARVGVWARGGLEGCRLRSLKYRKRVLWEAGGYGSGVVWLSVHGGEEKHPEVIQRVER